VLERIVFILQLYMIVRVLVVNTTAVSIITMSIRMPWACILNYGGGIMLLRQVHLVSQSFFDPKLMQLNFDPGVEN
jgi:hypothetical protein